MSQKLSTQQMNLDSGNRRNSSLWHQGLLVLLYFGLPTAFVLFPGPPLLDRLRWLDSGICAQLPTHSFYPGGERLPLCARNTGIYLGFFVTLFTLYATGRGRTQRFPPWPITVLLACGVLFLLIDGFNAFAADLGQPHLYTPNNLLRLATGLGTGLALAAFALPALNTLFWRESNRRASIPSWRYLLLLLPLLGVSFFAVASASSFVLYPVALLSTAGILIALGSVNLIVLVATAGRDETFTRYSEIFPFFSLALIFALGELLTLAQLKLLLLHTLHL